MVQGESTWEEALAHPAPAVETRRYCPACLIPCFLESLCLGCLPACVHDEQYIIDGVSDNRKVLVIGEQTPPLILQKQSPFYALPLAASMEAHEHTHSM